MQSSVVELVKSCLIQAHIFILAESTGTQEFLKGGLVKSISNKLFDKDDIIDVLGELQQHKSNVAVCIFFERVQ